MSQHDCANYFNFNHGNKGDIIKCRMCGTTWVCVRRCPWRRWETCTIVTHTDTESAPSKPLSPEVCRNLAGLGFGKE